MKMLTSLALCAAVLSGAVQAEEKTLKVYNWVGCTAVLRGVAFQRMAAAAKRGSIWPTAVSVIRPFLVLVCPAQGRNWLGATPLQRTKAWRKLAVSLKPSCSAILQIGNSSSDNHCLARSKRSSSSISW